jgi:hypothetical protein
MPLRLLNTWSTNLLPDDARMSFVRSIWLEFPSNLDHTCGYGERSVLHGVCAKFMQGQTDLLGRLWIQFQFGPLDKNRIVIQIMERGQVSSDKVSHIDAVPIVHHEKIVGFGKCT